MKLLVTIRFVGTRFCGYQVQPGKRTVQRELNEAAERLFGFPCDIVGCSRTDSGVHANAFCATVAKRGEDGLDTTVPEAKIPQALNALLPDDMAVVSAVRVEESFHARYDVQYKEYLYRIHEGPLRDPFTVDRAYFYRRSISDEAVAAMNEAAAHFCGQHDFASYMANGSKVSTTVRRVAYARVYREGGEVIFQVAADGFLYNMVRIMAGTLLAVAEGKLSPDDIPAITEACDRTRAGATAPACGLYLNKVVY